MKKIHTDKLKKTLQSEKIHTDMLLYFSLISIVAMLVTYILSGVIVNVLDRFLNISFIIPNFVWVIGFCVILGSVITLIMGWIFFSPITRLGKAMRDVASGDFSVRLETKVSPREVKDIYRNFNLMAEELGATEMLQTDFVSNVSHEFKTPINAIEGYAMLLQGCTNESAEQQEYIEKILYNTKRLSELMGNILLLSKVDNYAIQTKKETYRLDEQIRCALLMFEQKWVEKDIEFDIELDNVSYLGNESLMLHVWTNLIDNAIKFSNYGGMVKMHLKQQQNEICFMIEDTGPGIGEKEQRHIFDKFYQGDSSHRQEGNGLGLALVKQILETCGGSIEVDSSFQNGSRFVVRLPI